MDRERGFSLLEVMVALGIGLTITAAVGVAQSMVTNEIKSNQQKTAVLALGRDLATAMGKDDVCKCNFGGLALTDNAGGTYDAEISAGRSIASACGGPTLAAAGQPLPDGWGLRVSRVAVTDLTPIDGAAGVAKQYLGTVTIEFRGDQGPRAIRPLTSPRAFHVENGAILECGIAPENIQYVVSADAPVENDPIGYVASVAQCPSDTKVLGGGWIMMPPGPALKPGCVDPMFAEVIRNSVVPNSNAWSAVVRCHPVKAVAACWKPTDLGAAAVN